MAAITFLDAPVDVTPTDDGTYHDVDVTSYVSSASGVLLRVSHTSGGDLDFAARKNGSTDDYYADVQTNGHIYYAIGIDGSDIFECKLQTTGSSWLIELLGYFDSTDVVFFDDAVASPATQAAWTDWDISSDTGVDTAIAAICFAHCHSGSVKEVGFRKNGSTDDRTHDVPIQSIQGAIVVGVDGSEIFEYYRETDFIDPYVIGYIKSGVTMNTNATDISLGTTGSWTNLSSLGSDIDGIFVEAISSTTNHSWGLRPDGDADFVDHYEDIQVKHGWGIAGAVSDVVEGKIESTGVDFFLLGTIDSDGGGGISGSASITLGAATLNSSGSISIVGSTTVTLENINLDSDGTIDIEGITSSILEILTLDSTGAIGDIVTGEVNTTLEVLLVSATGEVDINGEFASTLETLTLSSDGTILVSSSSDITLEALTLTASGAVTDIQGDADITLDTIVLVSTGTVTGTGTTIVTITVTELTLEESRYPLSSADGKDIPLDVLGPIKYLRQEVDTTPLAFAVVLNGYPSTLLQIRSPIDIVISFADDIPGLSVDPVQYLLEADKSVVLLPTHLTFTMVALNSGESGDVDINILRKWNTLAINVDEG